MSRRALSWLLTVPLAVGASQLAHEASYRIVGGGGGGDRARLLGETGHGYFALAPALLGLGLALVTTAFALEVARSARRGGGDRVSHWPFALFAPLAFAFQEHCERLFHDAAIPWTAFLEPTFALGLALQLPFALAAYVLARLLVRAAGRLGRAIGGPPGVRRRSGPRAVRPALELVLPRVSLLASGHAQRGPPACSV